MWQPRPGLLGFWLLHTGLLGFPEAWQLSTNFSQEVCQSLQSLSFVLEQKKKKKRAVPILPFLSFSAGTQEGDRR